MPLAATHFSAWSTLKLYQRVHSADGPRANRYFCGSCGCSVAMSYPATGAWAEPNTLWLSAAFFPDADAQGFGNAVLIQPSAPIPAPALALALALTWVRARARARALSPV